MSDDIDRLKTQLSDLLLLGDGLEEARDAFGDVVNSVKPIELETDPEGHAALRDHAETVWRAVLSLRDHAEYIFALARLLSKKAGT